MVLALRFRVVHVSLKHNNTDHDQQKYTHTHHKAPIYTEMYTIDEEHLSGGNTSHEKRILLVFLKKWREKKK